MNLLPISHRQQILQADCLAACAAMILDYLHVPIQYEHLLRLLKVRSFGTSLFNLRNLQTLGLFVLIEEGNIAVLQAHLEMGLPPIVAVSTVRLASYWTEDTDHAVIVVGIDANFVYLHDPEFTSAPQVVDIKEFESAWLDQDYWYAVIGLDEIEMR
jgi:ABC-type bacteriocin/lantibiotic exporter with double-glycine peptidase domain